MPLVVLCGHPCAGKTTAAVRLKTYIENSMADETKESSQSSVSSSSLGKQDTQVVLVNEEALSIDRSCSFGDSTAERQTRGLLRAEAERHLSPRSIIILDSLNNIKGFRYELFTRAKASNTTLCVVYCDTSIETCRERNNARTSNKYPEEIFEDLVSRLEIPNSKNRWDSPLFTVKLMKCLLRLDIVVADVQETERAEFTHGHAARALFCRVGLGRRGFTGSGS
eukprot:728742_1